MFKKHKSNKEEKDKKAHSLMISELKEQINKELNDSPDLVFRVFRKNEQKYVVIFISNIVQTELIEDFVLKPVQEAKEDFERTEDIVNVLPLSQITLTNQLKEITLLLLRGSLYLYKEGEPFGIIGDVKKAEARALAQAETESLVYGPKISFTELLSTNINVLRNNIVDPNLVLEDITIGKRTGLQGKLIYIKDIADEENVNTLRQRINDLEIDHVQDSSILAQYIEDNSWTVFPQLITTELPDRLSIAILKGKVGVLMDRSPAAIYGPTTFFSFFESTEDIYMRWNMGTFLRLLRFVAIFLSVLLTPAYVAVLTYHYEVIPSPLLVSLGQSRSNVPFPPIFEALLLEFIIEMLREAGARLPTKVGQTMGIVGGIVIGQAAVDAGFTSNILIIIIAISALGSFTAPSYVMGSAIRIIRFPIIVLAGLWGGIGIMLGFCFLLIHLLKLSTMGRPYLSPIYPFSWHDLRYSMLRFPLQYLGGRPETNEPGDKMRYPKKKAKEKKDVDE